MSTDGSLASEPWITLAAGPGVVRHAFWLDSGVGSVPGWLHAPESREAVTGAAVICSPVGYEYTHSYRALLHLADALAARGLAAVRFDYFGTGAAQGSPFASRLVARWLEDIRLVAAFTADVTGVERCSLVGVQLGALLAAAAAPGLPVETLCLWAPVTQGRRFVRERRLLDRSSPHADAEGHYLDAGGFILSLEAADEIAALDIARIDYSSVRSGIVLIDREDVATPPRVLAALASQQVTVDVHTPGGYVDMIREPQYTIVPRQAIDRIASALCGGAVGPARGGSAARLAARHATTVSAPYPDHPTEELVLLDGEAASLYGVLTKGDGRAAPDLPLVVLVNAGSVHQVGPNRAYVGLTRALAAHGFPSLRLDLRNLGDSVTAGTAAENHPYPDTATADIAAAVQWARARGFAGVVLAGLCSGAHAGFRAALAVGDSSIRGLLLINPLTFRWSEGMSLDTPDSYQLAKDVGYYRAAMRDPAKWRRLLTAKTNTRYLTLSLVRRGVQVLRLRAEGGLRTIGLLAPTALDRELRTLAERGVAIDFVFSDSDPGAAILHQSASDAVRQLQRLSLLSLNTIRGADHTFSKLPARRSFISRVVEVLTDRFATTCSGEAPASIRHTQYVSGAI